MKISSDILTEEARPTDAQIKRIADLAKRQIELEDTVARLELEIAGWRKKLIEIQTITLPEAMKEIGVERLDLSTGEKITVREVVGASIKAENRSKAHDWLRKNGFGSLIKSEVVARFGMGEEGKAKKVLSELLKKGYDADSKETVHPQTLSAFVREQLGEGRSIPMDLLGVYRYNESKIVRPKDERRLQK